ncbi:hypothetical protein LT493_36875 [Streptomyces tricolor]|nr:hypothetical protein [Streptomyces tricolor]
MGLPAHPGVLHPPVHLRGPDPGGTDSDPAGADRQDRRADSPHPPPRRPRLGLRAPLPAPTSPTATTTSPSTASTCATPRPLAPRSRLSQPGGDRRGRADARSGAARAPRHDRPAARRGGAGRRLPGCCCAGTPVPARRRWCSGWPSPRPATPPACRTSCRCAP